MKSEGGYNRKRGYKIIEGEMRVIYCTCSNLLRQQGGTYRVTGGGDESKPLAINHPACAAALLTRTLQYDTIHLHVFINFNLTSIIEM